MMSFAFSRLPIVIGGLAIATGAIAGPVTWEVADATFSDGGTATGSFIYNADTNLVSALAIDASAGTDYAGVRFNGIISNTAQNFLFAVGTGYSVTSPPYTLQLILNAPLTDAGGTDAFTATEVCQGSCVGGFETRQVSGELISEATNTVPEPGSIALSALALAAVGLLRHQAKRRSVGKGLMAA